ncbi:hypothetical protein AIOL_003371 [Candidatus Rhodobacter oscarellae]|uniref:DnaJ homologue subfamily C member 28 conserved domain-containing protein n=1 Tax=Candidatus Rhodobacter oscarellae TaxID=1675527 RepID=A0A0J9GY47_9RHOB|nr:DUF1992 domain-containing protein [Candidatus Rhodobacter lobularis]KMW58398.1 hypothetical protein AIOL_003371 [Candidatus Rhodobacter lobularis]
MPRNFRQLTEAQIKKAEAEGKLSGLAGEGEPLPYRPGDAYIDPGDAVGHRIMAEAGALPEEITLKKQVAAAKDAYATASEADRKAAMARLADLELKLAIAQEARRKFLK